MTLPQPLTPEQEANMRDYLEFASSQGAEPRRGIIAYIFKHGTDASNGGISSRHSEVLVVGPGIPQIFKESAELPAVEIGTISFAGKTTYHLRPADGTGKRYMYGGTFIHSSDSRFRNLFPFNGAVPLHDRYEG